MEIRKLQRTGGSSLTLTLPKKWTESLKLKDKDSVIVHAQRSGVLVVQPENAQTASRTSQLDVEGLTDDMLLREIIAHYISGADEIHIAATDISAKQRNAIRQIAHSFVGFEIMDESGQTIVLKNVLDASKFPVRDNIGNIFTVTRSMVHDVLGAIVTQDKKLAQDVAERDAEIDKWQLAITRQSYTLMRDRRSEEELGLAYFELNYYEHVALQLERIADHAVKIAQVMLTKSSKIKPGGATEHFEQVTHMICTLLDKASKMVEQVDKHIAHSILSEYGNEKEVSFLAALTHDTRDPATILIEDSIDRWMGYIRNIAERTIDQAVVIESENQQ